MFLPFHIRVSIKSGSIHAIYSSRFPLLKVLRRLHTWRICRSSVPFGCGMAWFVVFRVLGRSFGWSLYTKVSRTLVGHAVACGRPVHNYINRQPQMFPLQIAVSLHPFDKSCNQLSISLFACVCINFHPSLNAIYLESHDNQQNDCNPDHKIHGGINYVGLKNPSPRKGTPLIIWKYGL